MTQITATDEMSLNEALVEVFEEANAIASERVHADLCIKVKECTSCGRSEISYQFGYARQADTLGEAMENFKRHVEEAVRKAVPA